MKSTHPVNNKINNTKRSQKIDYLSHENFQTLAVGESSLVGKMLVISSMVLLFGGYSVLKSGLQLMQLHTF